MRTLLLPTSVVVALCIAVAASADPFPTTAGTDFYPATTANAEIQLAMGGPPIRIDLQGPTSILRDAASENPGGLDVVATEIVSMPLTGASPVGMVSFDVNMSDATRRSQGMIRENSDGGGGEVGSFPATSFFDIFFEIDIPIPQLPNPVYNLDPVYMETIISDIPPDPTSQYFGLGWREFGAHGDFGFDLANPLHHDFDTLDLALWSIPLGATDPMIVGWLTDHPIHQVPAPGAVLLGATGLCLVGVLRRKAQRINIASP